MTVPIFVVDAFSARPFGGNPAGVCVLDQWPTAEWMQSVAAEMNHAETAFLVRNGDAYGLRWFTPAVEVDLCGHATLASAHILFSEHGASEELRFQTRSGLLTAKRTGDEIELDFPNENPVPAVLPVDLPFLPTPIWTGRNRMDWLAQVESPEVVRSLQPDFEAVSALGLRGLIVTAATPDAAYDFISRGFFPNAGIDEDPVTGSAHCALAPFWAARLGRPDLRGYQASQRGGEVGVSVNGDRVLLRGHAITTLRGTFHG